MFFERSNKEFQNLFLSMFIVLAVAICNSCTDQPTGVSGYSPVIIKNLRCEYLTDPYGIDVVKPRLSWVLESNQRGQKQNAYQILVADSEEKLKADKGDLWDSGKVESDETACVVYDGVPLQSHMSCFWKILVWDKDAVPSAWSDVAMWSMGLLQPEDWKAQWIGFDQPAKPNELAVELQDAHWIWYPELDSTKKTPSDTMYFRCSFDLPEEAKVTQAQCYITASGSFKLFVNGCLAGYNISKPKAEEIIITELLGQGKNVIAISVKLPKQIYEPNNPAGLIAAIKIEFAGNKTTIMVTDKQWVTANEEKEDWKDLHCDDSSWKAASEVEKFGYGPWGKIPIKRFFLPPPKYLRKDFTLNNPVNRAQLFVTAFGLYQMHINGQRVGNDYFSPGWTDYNKRIYYRTYDVTNMLKNGDNAIGAILADGWYAGYIGFGLNRNHYGEKPRLLAQLRIEFKNGSSDIITTDSSWKASLGPILEADFLMGETYDARREMPGWATADFNDTNWLPVQTGSELSPQVHAVVSQPVTVFTELSPLQITEPIQGRYVFDMGQNFAGVVRLKVRGKSGQKVTLRFAERLKPDGTIYTENLRSARAIDSYICKGNEMETWQPYFTFHGFQFVELTGLNYKPDRETITGIALSSDTPVVGYFECSDEMVNKLYSNIVWTQRMNFIDIPTDCPQRDERLGWTGDAQVYIRTASMNCDVQAFFTKWLVDLTDAQRTDGQFPMVAPLKSQGISDDGGPAWADAGVICPWTIYKVYSDKRILERHYTTMTRFIDFCRNRCTEGLLPPEKFHCFGDWLNIEDDTPKDVLYMAYFAHSTKLTAQAACVLGKTQDALMYHNLFDKIKTVFNKTYVDTDGRIRGDSQTAYVLAIAYNLLDEDKMSMAAGHLIDKIKNRDWHLSTGFVGTKDLMTVLTSIGRTDVAYRLLRNDTFPSWGFSIKHGATSIWERWDGWTPEKGFQDPSMNSFAHYSFGAVAQWMFENIGGIDTDSPGFKRVIIRPQPGGNLTYAKNSYKSIRGRIATDWKIVEGNFLLSVTLPANTTAMVYVPALRCPLSLTNMAFSRLSITGSRLSSGTTLNKSGVARYGCSALAYDFRSGFINRL